MYRCNEKRTIKQKNDGAEFMPLHHFSATTKLVYKFVCNLNQIFPVHT